jgi:hypothetical protein
MPIIDPPGSGVGPVNGTTPVNGFLNGSVPLNGAVAGVNGSAVNGSAVPPVADPEPDPQFIDPTPAWDHLDFAESTNGTDTAAGQQLTADLPAPTTAGDEPAGHPAMDFAAPPFAPATMPSPTPRPVEQTPAPGAERSVPCEGTPAPGEGTPAPGEGTSAPGEGTSAPGEGSPAYSEGTWAYREDTAAAAPAPHNAGGSTVMMPPANVDEPGEPEPPAMDFAAPAYQSPTDRAVPPPTELDLRTALRASGDDNEDDTAVIPRLTENRAEPQDQPATDKPAKPKYVHPLAHLEGFDPESIDGLDGIDDDFGSEPWRTQALRPPMPPNFPRNPGPAPGAHAAPPAPGGYGMPSRRPAPYRNDESGLAALNLIGDNQPSGSRTQQMPGFFDEPPRQRRPDVDSGRGGSGRTVGVIIAIVVLCLAGYGGYWLVGHFTGDKSKPTGSSSSAPANNANTGNTGNTGNAGNAGPTNNGGSKTTGAQSSTAAAGYKTYHGQHFSASVPTSWRPDPQSSGVLDFNDPKGDRFVRFVVNVESGGDLVGGFQSAETQFAASHEGYHRVAIKQASYRGYPAADWEFTYNRSAQDVRHVLYRAFTVGTTTYGIYISAPDSQYSATLPMFNEAAKTFQVRH